MIGELLDKAIGVFSPSRGAIRSRQRTMATRAYDAAKKSRLTANWSAQNRSADLELLSDADTIRARARSLVRDNAYAKGVLRAIVRNVVGRGIKPQARAVAKNGSVRSGFNSTIETIFARWQRSADVTGRLSFYEIQSLVQSELVEAGEVLIHFVEIDDPSRPIPLAIELVEADRLDNGMFGSVKNPDNGNEIRRGVELDSVGRPVAYWLYPNHPNDVHGTRMRGERWPADQFLHLFKQERVSQTRGISAFAPVVRWLKDLHYYTENELVSSAVASCFSVAITTMSGSADGGLLDNIDDDTSDTDGNTFEYLQPGMVPRLMPGEDVKVINPTRQNSSANEWIMLILRSVAVGMGLSYERLVRDYSQTNYSSNRASDLEDRREFRPMQDFLVDNLCLPVWERFLSSVVSAAADGRIDPVGIPTPADYVANYASWSGVKWLSPGWEWVDPVKEAKAAQEGINSNLTTLTEELGKRGRDLRETLEQRALEQAMLEELGLTMSPESNDVEETEQAET